MWKVPPLIHFRWLVILAILFPSLVCAQGVQYTRKEAGDGGTAVPYPLVTVCTSGAAYTPLPCTPKASIYSDAALTVPLANPFRGDMFGNIEFYATPAAYIVSVTAPYSPGYSFKMSASGGFAGSIASTQVAVGTALNTIGGSANFTYDPVTKALLINGPASSLIGLANPSGQVSISGAAGTGALLLQASPVNGVYSSLHSGTGHTTGVGASATTVWKHDDTTGYTSWGGSTSGRAGIGAAAVAGTPNTILLPLATGAASSLLQSDGANPQQSSWTTTPSVTSLTAGTVNGIRFVDGTTYATIAAALAGCPATGVKIFSTITETFASDPFAAVTCPFDIWLIGGVSTNIWKTNVGLRIGHNGQRIHGAGPNLTTLQANSGTFPSTTAVISVGAPGPSGVNGSGVFDLAVDCASVTACIGIHLDGAQELSGTQYTQVVNAMTAGYEVSSAQGAGADQNRMPLEHIRAACSVSAAATCVPVLVASTAGARVVIKDVTAVTTSPTVTTDCIRSDSSNATVILENAHVEECTNGFHHTVAGGQFEVDGITGSTTTTSLVRNDSASASYQLRHLILNSSTNTLVDAGRSITTASVFCGAAGVTTLFVLCNDALVPNQSAAPYQTTGTKPTITGTGACATSDTKAGGAWAGTFRCTGVTGASTVTITFAATVVTGYSCPTSDETTANALRQSAHTQTTCVISGTVNQNDILVFTASAF